MKIQGLHKYDAVTINAMAEDAWEMVREGRKLVIKDLEEYHCLIGCGIRDFTVAAFFLSSGERDKFERENLENGSSLTVVSTYECTIDQLPDDFISELFSEWV